MARPRLVVAEMRETKFKEYLQAGVDPEIARALSGLSTHTAFRILAEMLPVLMGRAA